MRTFFTGAAVLAVCMIGSAPASALTMLKTSQWQSCPTTGCLSSTGRLSRIFDAAAFTGSEQISSFTFDRSLLGRYASSTFRLTFWTQDGEQVGDFESFNISVLGGDTLTLRGKAFNYDPSRGNLVVRLQFMDRGRDGQGSAGAALEGLLDAPGASDAAASGGFGGGGGGGAAAAAPSPEAPAFSVAPFEPTVSSPITKVSFDPPGPLQLEVTPLPEPATWLQLIAGFGLIGAISRRRRRILA